MYVALMYVESGMLGSSGKVTRYSSSVAHKPKDAMLLHK